MATHFPDTRCCEKGFLGFFPTASQGFIGLSSVWKRPEHFFLNFDDLLEGVCVWWCCADVLMLSFRCSGESETRLCEKIDGKLVLWCVFIGYGMLDFVVFFTTLGYCCFKNYFWWCGFFIYDVLCFFCHSC